ncbi:hypothetical protein Glove_307g72 [Diversispora epigaea]|uniref:HAT C-terminal dimerisation domain-containing protein n=1 Tax=Diversispora epigaea TaxID=1348612 RepID=A0A397HTD7_9GLOM|nr:hypothetical protein Glove_307g72 [Diversispora epigaea]
MGEGRHSSEILIAQMQSYSKFEKPWDIKYIEAVALKIISLTPHNVSCKRIFSILGWFCNKRRIKLNINWLEIMSKLHSYYITNAQTELKHMHREKISENQIDNIIHSIQYNENEELDEIEEFEDEEINETNEKNESNDSINNDLINFNDYFNFSSEQFCKTMKMNVLVVIEQEPEILHGDLNFNNNELLNNILN